MQRVWGEERFIQDFGGETRGKRLLGRHRRRWEDNIKTDLQEVGWANWIDLTQDRDRWRDFKDGNETLVSVKRRRIF
jgi:hypothetical protein